ncbi:hypothetical protein [Nocardioides sp. YIM 152315]|uniref:hypothetical protein n=1 Tax=Nocardioides sp. YIM 152315 TaxID=3031760 RepID=UPI0023DB9F98|nr:hypothetical protein [Nocardioides sp. YIM 152315]MDF1603887.1 hypothetical protein [Nocardioides sp. YIM 152315]
MSDQDDDAVVERFQPTSGRISGVLGLIVAGVVIVLALAAWDAGTALGVAIVAVLGAVLVWAALLRPALWVTRRDLVMRGMFHTDRVPLAAIDRVRVTQVLTVVVGERRMVSPVVGYSLRQLTKARIQTRGGIEQPHLEPLEAKDPQSGAPLESAVHQAFVESRIDHLARTARDQSGIRPGSPEQHALAHDVRRTWALPELAAAGLFVVAFVVWLALH